MDGINKRLPQGALGIGRIFKGFKKFTEWGLGECLRNKLLHIGKSVESVSLEVFTEQSLGLKPFCHGLGSVCFWGSSDTLGSEVLLGNAKLIDGGDIKGEQSTNRLGGLGVGNCLVNRIKISLAVASLFARQVSSDLVCRQSMTNLMY